MQEMPNVRILGDFLFQLSDNDAERRCRYGS